MGPYTVDEVYWHSTGDRPIFWPVLQRPGRQRKSRLGFRDLFDAMRYGVALAERHARIFGGERGQTETT